MLSVLCAFVFSAAGAYVLLSYNTSVTFFALVVPFFFLLTVYGLFLAIFRNHVPASIVSGCLLLVLYFADAMVFQSRFFHIRYTDLAAANDAMRVAGKYSLSITWDHIRIVVIVAASCVAIAAICKKAGKPEKKGCFFVGLSCVLACALLFLSDGLFNYIPKEEEGLESAKYVPTYGLAYTWYMQYRNSRLVLPDDYSPAKAEALLESASAPPRLPERERAADYPDVIVIMNESLADYALCGTVDYPDPLPRIHGAGGGITERKLVVSIYGGYTANTEFEFLTGDSLLFLPDGTIPYMRFMNHALPGLPKDLASLGYQTTAVHPFYSVEWNRVNAYKCLGFERFISGDDLASGTNDHSGSHRENLFAFGEESEYIRGFINDRQCYESVLSTLDEADPDRPSFVFAVTIQNHGGYLYADGDFVSEPYTGIADVDQYLTLSRISDEAFYQLTERLRERERKTLVLMFGDHQPAIRIDGAITWNTAVDALNQYSVPYILWANYEIDPDAPAVLSPNYLSAVLKECAGLPLTAWDAFRLSAMKEYEVLTANLVMKQGECLAPAEAKSEEALRRYEIVQDYLLFDADT